jgi:hypothetical protein
MGEIFVGPSEFRACCHNGLLFALFFHQGKTKLVSPRLAAIIIRSGLWLLPLRGKVSLPSPQVELSNQLISVSGCAHSGTTLVATMIGSHSEARLIPYETNWFTAPTPLSKLRAKKAIKFISRSIRDYPGKIVVEKTPRHVFRIPEIAGLLPGTKFIVTVRDPRALVASLTRRFHDYETAVRRALGDYSAVNQIRRRSDVMLVRYEDLTERFLEIYREIALFLGFTPRENPIEFHKRAPDWFRARRLGPRVHNERRRQQMQQPIFRNREDWDSTLSAEQEADVIARFSTIAHRDYADFTNTTRRPSGLNQRQ